MKLIPVCSIITKEALSEFFLLKYSIEQYHNCIWYLSTDEYSANVLKGNDNVNIFKLVNETDFQHGVNNVNENTQFFDMLMTKFDVIKIALKNHKYTLFIDTDMVFLNKIEERLFEILEKGYVSIILTPHYTRDKINENRVGYFNAGMFLLNDINFLEDWKNLCYDRFHTSTYYEQPPLEEVIEKYKCMTLPINYNVGWWRFKQGYGESRYKDIALHKDEVTFFNMPVINLHLHVLKKLTYENYGAPLYSKVKKFILSSNNEKYKELLSKISDLKKHDCL